MSVILDYGHKVDYNLPRDGVTRFGIELEIVSKALWDDKDRYDDEDISLEKQAKKIHKEFKGECIFKHDGSLDGEGFEIVTKPLIVDEHKEFWTENIFKMLAEKGFVSYDYPTAGMHIHVSKAYLSQLQIGKVVKFIHQRTNRPFIKKIAQREEKHYAEFSSKKDFSYAKGHGATKYSAVNVAPKTTVEFRLFKGTLSHAAFHKNLEFTEALINFCSPGVTGVKESSHWWNFIYYVSQNKKQYPFLWEYCIFKKMDCLEKWKEHLTERAEKKSAQETSESNFLVNH